MATLITDDFQVFIKPVGANCNLKCSYCYYLGKGYISDKGTTLIISDETLEKCIKQHFEASSGHTVLFTWHGGEPLLAGINFYEKVLLLQKKHLPKGKNFLNGIQTNGTLITKEWCEFFAANKFAVGISIDGPEVFHNAMRHTSDKAGSFEKTLNGCLLLREYGVNPEILCVVNSYNVKYPLIVYDFFKMLGVDYITFLPLIEKNNKSASVPALEFGLFLSAVFDEWLKSDIGSVKIQIFEEALRTAFNQEHSLCIFRERCGSVPVIEHNGDFYSCDHFVEKNRPLGNINEHSLVHFLKHPIQKAFGDIKLNTLPQYCIECEVRNMCNGECPKNRFIKSPDGEPGLNYLCEGYKYFFNHCKPFINSVSEVWKTDNK
ncbi:MAG: anaerobic sulfatase maturase [Bacteroidales bacterium]|jgi:uncharacterized protein|nr:anaerobic sulfatase maturase [Bacteroidales bacterium]